MIRFFSRCIGASVALLTVVSLSGCIEQEQTTLIVMPDGSGKLTVECVFNQNVSAAEVQRIANTAQRSFDVELALAAGNLPKGLVAIANWEQFKVDGKLGLRLTYYFDDLRAFGGVRPKEPFTKEGEGFALDVPRGLAPSLKTQGAKGEGPKSEVRYILPGEVKTAGGASAERASAIRGRTATFGNASTMTSTLLNLTAVYGLGEPTVDGDGNAAVVSPDFAMGVLFGIFEEAAGEPNAKAILEMPWLRITCGPNRISKEEEAAFRAELTAAKAAWDKRLKQSAEILLNHATGLMKTPKRKETEAVLAAIAKRYPDAPQAAAARKLRDNLLLVMKQESAEADKMLKKAKSQRSSGNASGRMAARDTVAALLEKYPDTPAAEEARKLLAQWNPKPPRGAGK